MLSKLVVRRPLPRQVRVPSIEAEPPTIGIEDEDPGVRLEVRFGATYAGVLLA